MIKIDFNKFYRYEDMTLILHEFASKFPKLVQIRSIGKSFEGRDIWTLIVTNVEAGPDTHKPAVWVDGNIHATEVSASTACLYHLNKMVNEYGHNDLITRCLDSRVFYITPRLNPDGAEWALSDRPKFIRSSTRPYPYDEEPFEGLIGSEDIDSDGRILTMRILDANGPWKTHPDDPRLMIRRDPTEVGGTYYRLLSEGRIKNYDGVNINVHRPKEGLDLNRNFPMEWRQENEQPGAGPYPTSEPEVTAMVDFLSSHNNITSVITFHTYAGVILRPYASKSDDELPVEDLWTFQKIGNKGSELTGYPNISIFHEFKYHPKQVITGGSDWCYEHLGMFFWAVELWSPMRQAGIKDYKYIDWFREHPIEDDVALMKWNDEILHGKGYVDWYEYDHPELGKIELGGWNSMACWRNPPPEFLEKEVGLFPDWLIWQALISPQLNFRDIKVEKVAEASFSLKVVVENSGWLPSYVTKKALEKKSVRGIIAEIFLPESAILVSGKLHQEFGQLEGRAYKSASNPDDSTTDRILIEWVIKSEQGSKVLVTIRHDRAGYLEQEINLI